MSWYRRNSRRGSLALFFCMVLSVLLLIFGVLIQGAQIKAAENDLNRALSAQIQTGLAAYDRSWLQFGLFGFRAETTDPAVFLASLPVPLRSCTLRMEPLAPLSEPAVLDRQIIRYMKGRLPAVYLDLLLNQLANIRSIVSRQSPVDLNIIQPTATISRLTLPKITSITTGGLSGNLQDLLNPFLANLSGSSLQEAADSLFGGILNQLQDQALLQLQEIYQQYAAELFGVEADGALSHWLGQMPDFLNPESVSQLAGFLDQLLAFETSPVYDKCCLVEYILGHFRPLVQKMNQEKGDKDLQTLDGRFFKNLPDNRDAEVERIMTGLSGSGTATLAVQAILTSLRSILHLAALLTDQAGMASMRTAASGISAAIATLTAGTVVIDPQIMVYLLVAGRAIGEGLSDCRKLLAGDGLDFWPGKSPVQVLFHYQDYLRLFLLVVPQPTLLKRTAERLKVILPGPCYTGLRASTVYRRRTISQSSGYLTWES